MAGGAHVNKTKGGKKTSQQHDTQIARLCKKGQKEWITVTRCECEITWDTPSDREKRKKKIFFWDQCRSLEKSLREAINGKDYESCGPYRQAGHL